jgi:hypothetical protein
MSGAVLLIPPLCFLWLEQGQLYSFNVVVRGGAVRELSIM